MSVLINMEMPTSCYDCPMAMKDYTTLFGKNFKQTRNSYACVLTHKAITSTKRNRFCPLIEIPPHGRLIDADALEDKCIRMARDEWNKSTGTTWGYAYATFESDVEDAPTIIEAEEGER